MENKKGTPCRKGKATHIDIAFAVLLLLASLLLFAGVLGSALSAFLKFLLAVALLAACGYGVARAFCLECWYGMFLLRSQWGLSLLDRLAKRYHGAWNGLLELGTVMGFGSLAYFLLPRRGYTWQRVAFTYVLGTLLLVLSAYIIAPLATSALFSMLSGGEEFAGAGEGMRATVSQFALSKYIYVAILAFGGISFMTTAGLLIYALIVAASIIGALFGGSALSSVSPGGTPIIPGINLPLFEGVAALAVVLIVHEGMHGIVARMHRFPLKSAGIVLFGFLPFGAFVDIDEKRLLRGSKVAQNAVFAAGTTANFFAAFAIAALLFAFSAATEPFRLDGVYAESGSAIPRGAIISAINGDTVHAFMGGGANLSANTAYTVSTSKGDYLITTDSKGKLGVGTVVAERTGSFGVFRYADGFGWMAFVLRFLALAFALNFVVGAINLVPIPLFDGFYLMKNGVGSEIAAKAIAAAAAAAFLMNLLPWIFR